MNANAIYLLLYVLAKFVAYSLWCAYGIQRLWSFERAANVQLATASGTSPAKKLLLAGGYGFLRLLMGVFFGILIWILGTMVAGNLWDVPHRDIVTYLLVYVPVRWVEWSILDWIMARKSGTKMGYAWRFGGIAVSCVADIPIMAATGWMLPLGRFFC